MKKFLALLVSAVLLLGLLVSFPSAGSDETGPATNENSMSYESSLGETPEDGTSDEETYDTVLKLNKVVVDKDGKPYYGEPDKEFTIHVTGPDDYSKTVKIKANHEETLTELRPGTYLIQEDASENYTRIDENTSVTLGQSEGDRYFPDRVTAHLGSDWVGDPVLPGRSNPAAALVDEPYDTDIPYQDGNFLSLGYGGVAVFEYDEPFYNGPGVEVGVSEITWFFDEYGESAYVEVSQDGTEGSWKYLGGIYGNTHQESNDGEFFTFDMENTGLEWARFIRITDDSGRAAAAAAVETVSNTTGPGAEYGDPMDGVDINYVCTRYMDNIKYVEIVNQHKTQDNPPVVTPPTSSPTSPEPQPVYFTLTTAVSGQGTILPWPGVSSHEKGITVQLKAEPAAGWEFDHWQGDTVDEKNQIYIDGNKSVTAVFRQLPAAQPETAETVEPALTETEEQAPQEEEAPAVETVEDEELPAALPKTGGIPALFFIGIGGALILAGIAAGIKRK